jgi:hypothetical protein
VDGGQIGRLPGHLLAAERGWEVGAQGLSTAADEKKPRGGSAGLRVQEETGS